MYRYYYMDDGEIIHSELQHNAVAAIEFRDLHFTGCKILCEVQE
jgi:hypothetical protein